MLKSAANFGFVYGASGQGYTDLAVTSAWSLRDASPDAKIELFTCYFIGALL